MIQILITKDDRQPAVIGIPEGENITRLEAAFIFDLVVALRAAEKGAIVWEEEDKDTDG